MIYQGSIVNTWPLCLVIVTPYSFILAPRLPSTSRGKHPMRKAYGNRRCSAKPPDHHGIGLLNVFYYSRIHILFSSNIILVTCAIFWRSLQQAAGKPETRPKGGESWRSLDNLPNVRNLYYCNSFVNSAASYEKCTRCAFSRIWCLWTSLNPPYLRMIMDRNALWALPSPRHSAILSQIV